MFVETQKGSATSAKPTPGTDSIPMRGVIIAHLCNTVSAWGAGFVLAVDDLSLAAKFAYKALCKDYNGNVPLGTTQFVEVKPDVWIANMIAQSGVDKSVDACLVDYKALSECLNKTFDRARLLGCNVHIPSGMGSGLAGGDEAMIHSLINGAALNTTSDLLERQMKFVPRVTLWEFDDPTAKSYIGKPTVPKKVDSVFGTPDDTDDIDIDLDLDKMMGEL